MLTGLVSVGIEVKNVEGEYNMGVVSMAKDIKKYIQKMWFAIR